MTAFYLCVPLTVIWSCTINTKKTQQSLISALKLPGWKEVDVQTI